MSEFMTRMSSCLSPSTSARLPIVPRRRGSSTHTVAARRGTAADAAGAKRTIAVPWFAFGFLAVIGFNSFDLLPQSVVAGINEFDTFLLTMAMTALGTETSFAKFRQAGARPFLLAGLLYVWLLAGGYALSKYLLPLFG